MSVDGTFRTCRDFGVESAFGGKAEVGFRVRQGPLLALSGHSPKHQRRRSPKNEHCGLPYPKSAFRQRPGDLLCRVTEFLFDSTSALLRPSAYSAIIGECDLPPPSN